MSLATSASIPLGHLPLRPSTLVKFQQRGFTSTAEVEKSRRDGGIANLAAELGLSLREATDFYRELQGCVSMTANSPSQLSVNHRHNSIGNSNSIGNTTLDSSNSVSAKTASEILSLGNNSSPGNHHNNHQPRNMHVVSFCRSIDKLLGGGVSLGEVTEIAGNPGCGKTQLAIQLSVDARLPNEYGGVAGETVYIDTEGNFAPERCYTMAQALVNHVRKSADKKRRQATNRQQQSAAAPTTVVPEWFVPETILQGIHVYRAHDEAAQTAIISDLPQFLQERAQLGCPVKLLVVDSIAFHYRCAPPGGNYMARTRSLSTVASLLSDIASSFEIAVVVINQMTTKFGMSGTGPGESSLVPALGESWAHATTTRLVLSSSGPQNQNYRTCTLVKSPHKPCGTATYKVIECGIRDVDTPDLPVGPISDPASKRMRTN